MSPWSSGIALGSSRRWAVGPNLSQIPPVSGALAWYDASDAATVHQTAGAVDSWDDKSGNGRTLTATLTTRPTTGTITQNGKNGIDFDGVDDLMASGAFARPGKGTVYAVVRGDAGGSGLGFMHSSLSISFNSFFQNSGGTLSMDGGGSLIGLNQDFSNVAHIITNVYNLTQSKLRVDGRERAAGTTNDVSTNAAIALGGNVQGPNLFYDGGIFEWLYFPDVHTELQQRQVEAWLRARWAPGPPLAGAFAWWDPSNVNNLTLLGNGKVSALSDLSGNGRTLTQGGDAFRPTLGLIGDKQALRFNGAVGHTLNTAAFTLAQPYTVGCAFQSDVAGATPGGLQNRGVFDLGGGGGQMTQHLASGQLGIWAGGPGFTSAVGNDLNVHTAVIIFNGASSELYVDTVLVASGDAGAGGTVSGMFMGSYQGSQGWWFGCLGEQIVYASALGATDRTNLANYLRAGYG